MTERSLILDGIYFAVPALTIIQGAYLKVEPGGVCGLFGRNGSGKSTLLKVATGQIQPQSGITIIDGERLHRRSVRKRFAALAYLPQESMLPPDITVDAFVRTASTSLGRNPIIGRVRDRRIEDLSGGERRFLEVAFVLSLRRRYVLLDEPFTGVEPILIDEISTLITQAASEGAGILVTDHYHQCVLPIADTAYLMDQKQCYSLGEDPQSELAKIGYLPKGTPG